MSKNIDTVTPVLLELAPLPREQIGPFLLLGVDKRADKSQIEAAWAQRVIWARKKQVKTPLEDINWSREIINDYEKRLKADAASLNIDTTDQVLQRLSQRFGGNGQATARPLDDEKSLADYPLYDALPELAEIRASIPQPESPRELPAVQMILAAFAHQPLDPWADV